MVGKRQGGKNKQKKDRCGKDKGRLRQVIK